MAKQVIISIDGPSAAGKGAVSLLLAKRLGLPLLDSGAIYRSLALLKKRYSIESIDRLAIIVRSICIRFRFKNDSLRVLLHGEDVTDLLRTSECAKLSSKIAAFKCIRQSIYSIQRSFLGAYGLVADGRDMGTVIFPESTLKVYLTASLAVRARRRYADFKRMGIEMSLEKIYELMGQRDQKDRNRRCAPLALAKESIIIDSSHISVYQVVTKVLRRLT